MRMRYNELDFDRCCNAMYAFRIQDGSTPQHSACRTGRLFVAAMLIDKYGANPTADDKVRVSSDDA